MWLDLASPVTVARVVAKKESVSFESNPDGGWTSAWRLAVRFPTADEREHDALITVEQEVFDSVRVGSRLRVRYLACCPIFARSADRSTLSLLGDVRREHDLPRATTLLWLAIGLVALFNGSTHLLIPLFAVGVFLCFTLSQAGMVRHWLRRRGPGWRVKMAVNGVGAVTTALVSRSSAWPKA